MRKTEEIMIPRIPGCVIEPRHLSALVNTLDDMRKALPPSVKLSDDDVVEAIFRVCPPPEHGGRKHLQNVALYRNAIRHRLYALAMAFRDPRMRRFGTISHKVVDIDDAVIRGACKARLVIREDWMGWFDIKDLIRCIEREQEKLDA
jgi:hypothetical protein